MGRSKDLIPDFSLPKKKKIIDIQVLDVTSVLLLGKEIKIDELAEHLAETLARYKSQAAAAPTVVAHISAGASVTMATIQEVQNILRQTGIQKVQHLTRDKKASEVLIF